MKVYLSALLGRQVDGENVFLKIEKASTDKTKIEKFIQELQTSEACIFEGFQCVGERSFLTIDVD